MPVRRPAHSSLVAAAAARGSTATDTNPRNEKDWLKIEYIGVPPGKNGRCLVATNTNGRLRHLFTEGWPQEQRTGRQIGVQKVRLIVGSESLKVFENDELLYEHEEGALSFTKAYLCLQISTHSNYPPREVFFDEVCVTPQPLEGETATAPR